MRTWFILLCVVALVSTAAAQQEPQQARGEKAKRGQEKADPKKGGQKKNSKAPGDAYSGKTVRNRTDGMGLLKFREKRAPKVGQVAPKMRLTTADGKRVIDLASFRGKRPVVLVFGSYT